MRVVAGFHTRDDEWILEYKLRSLAWCDRVHVLIDRSPDSIPICEQFSNVTWEEWDNLYGLPDDGPEGPICEEGAMRQWVWDELTRDLATGDYVILGDTDEILTPDAVRWFADGPDPKVNLWYTHWVNLYRGAGQYAGGVVCPWSYERPGSNKKGAIIRYDESRIYRYDLNQQRHTRLEPSPLDTSRAVFDPHNKLTDNPLMVHWKWANWPRWQQTYQAGTEKYGAMFDGAEIKAAQDDWHWFAASEDMIANLPEPIAVVGNGAIDWQGKEIDSHATVVRFNNYKLHGHGHRVGKRLDLWVTNCWDDVEHRDYTGPILTCYTIDDQPHRVYQWLSHYPHMGVSRDDIFSDARGHTPVNPSTGFAFAVALSKAGKQFELYGFDGFKTGHYWNAYHRHTDTHQPTEALAIRSMEGATVR